jgi:hypothetical protein
VNETKKSGPVEVWLRQRNLEVTGLLVYEDESGEPVTVRSLTMRGAEREVTSQLRAQGFEPTGRWETTADNVEVMRRFRK